MKPLFILLASFLGAGRPAAEIATELDAIVASYYRANEPGAAVLVTKDGGVLLRKGYGLADLEQGMAIAPDMVFRIGSVTKQFTAAAILILEQQGKLSVADDIRKHLPDYPTSGRTITIEHLLTHTSGIRSYTDMEDFRTRSREDMTVEQVIGLFRDQPLAFEPGEKYAYNNSGYFLLGAIVEEASGKTYEAFVHDHIFAPLGMNATTYGSASRIIPRRVQGYDLRNGEFQNASYLSMTLPYAAGALLSTVDDLAKWDRALEEPGILSAASLEKWWKPFRLASGESTYYGYGWNIASYRGLSIVGHGGGINGFLCHMLRIPEERLFVAVLTNRNDEKINPAIVARKLAASAIGAPIETPSIAAVDRESLSRREGVYRTATGARYVVEPEEDRLFLRRFGDEHPEGGRTRNPGPNERLNRTASELLPASPTEFFFEDSLTRVRFEGPSTLVVDDWGREERAEKTDEPFDDESRVLAAIHQLFEGVSKRDREMMLAVFDDHARLVRTETRNGRPSIEPMTVSEFVDRIAENRGPTLTEKLGAAEVRIADNLATVWTPYDFYVGGELVHCGEDAFQLARTDLGWPGWKIVALADTRRAEDCAESRP